VSADQSRGVVRYRTIVADPPWPQRRVADSELIPLPYPTMSLDEIAQLPVRRLAQSDVAGNRPDKSIPRDGSVLYLWTTTQFLDPAFDVCRAWGFVPGPVLVWCKPILGAGAPGGTFRANVEFVIVGRRGSPRNATGETGLGRIWRQGYRRSWAWEPPNGGPTIYGCKTMKAAKERAESGL